MRKLAEKRGGKATVQKSGRTKLRGGNVLGKPAK